MIHTTCIRIHTYTYTYIHIHTHIHPCISVLGVFFEVLLLPRCTDGLLTAPWTHLGPSDAYCALWCAKSGLGVGLRSLNKMVLCLPMVALSGLGGSSPLKGCFPDVVAASMSAQAPTYNTIHMNTTLIHACYIRYIHIHTHTYTSLQISLCCGEYRHTCTNCVDSIDR